MYEIKLNLDVNTTSVDRAIAKVDELNKKANIHGHMGMRSSGTEAGAVVGGGVGHYRRKDFRQMYPNIPLSQRPNLEEASYRLRRLGGRTGSFYANINEFYKRRNFMSSRFIGNLGSISGWYRNFGNLTKVIAQLGKTAGAVVPALKLLGATIGLVLGARIVKDVYRFGALWIGNRLMKSETLAQGSSNIMQMNIAKNILGDKEYGKTWESATRMSEEFGFSRTAMLGTMSMLKGLQVGNKKLTSSDTEMITRAIGKIAQSGTVPYERAAINMQQILGSSGKPRTRDIQEIVHGTPAFGTITRQIMTARGVAGGDIQGWLQNKANMIEALAEFDRKVESNPYMRARGQIQLAKENFAMNVVQNNPETWSKISEGMTEFYDQLAKIVNSQLLPALADALKPENIKSAMEDLKTGINAISGIFKVLGFLWKGSFGEYSLLFGKYIHYGRLGQGPFIGTIPEGANLITEGTPRFNYDMPYFNKETGKTETEAIRQAKISAMQKAGVGMYEWEKYLAPSNKNYFKAVQSETGLLPSYFLPSYFEFNKNGFSGLGNGIASGSNQAASDALTSETKGARALTINFNREIVNMPINIDKMNNGDDLIEKIRSIMPEMIVRGMSTALNNATAIG